MRNHVSWKFVFAATLAFTSFNAFGQVWPQRPIKVLIGFAAAGTPDIATRMIAPKLGEALGQPIVIENRPGAGGVIAMEAVAKAVPDGYTIALGTVGTMFLAKALIPTAAYDPVTSFAPLGSYCKFPFILVSNVTVPVHTAKEFMDLAKAQPGKLNYGASTPGSPPHILAELFKSQARVDIFGINYKGSADAVTRFLAGDVQMMVDAWPSIGPMLAAKKARALLVTSNTRNSKIPEVPTAPEVGLPDYIVESWLGFVGPAGTSDAIVTRFNSDLAKVMATREMAEGMDNFSMEVFTNTPEQFAARIRSDWQKWSGAVKAAGIKVQ